MALRTAKCKRKESLSPIIKSYGFENSKMVKERKLLTRHQIIWLENSNMLNEENMQLPCLLVAPKTCMFFFLMF
jgi:hypothetical protein